MNRNSFWAGHFTEASAHLVLIKLRKVRIRFDRLNNVFVEGLISNFQLTYSASSLRSKNVEPF